MRILSPEESAKVLAGRVLAAPARFVRVNKDKTGESLEAKSRLVVPGHLAPKDEVRTDAPVAPQLMLHILFSWAVNRGLMVSTFDVGDAFLNGKSNTRQLFVRPPRKGIPGTARMLD